VFLCGVGVRIGSKRIRTPEGADLSVGAETAVKEHTPTAPALAIGPDAPIQRLAEPLVKTHQKAIPPSLPIVAPAAPALASRPELHPSLPPAAPDVLAELGELAGEVPSSVAETGDLRSLQNAVTEVRGKHTG
jgi:hypothetical protein